jgi:hypothetical protein
MGDLKYYEKIMVKKNKDTLNMIICQVITNKHENICAGLYRNYDCVPGRILSEI